MKLSRQKIVFEHVFLFKNNLKSCKQSDYSFFDINSLAVS